MHERVPRTPVVRAVTDFLYDRPMAAVSCSSRMEPEPGSRRRGAAVACIAAVLPVRRKAVADSSYAGDKVANATSVNLFRSGRFAQQDETAAEQGADASVCVCRSPPLTLDCRRRSDVNAMRYKAEQKATSRDALVRGAARVLRERGYAGVGVDELSDSAGLTSGAFYKHFPSKSQLLLEVVRVGVDRVAKRVRSLRSSPDVDSIGGWVNDFATFQSSSEHLKSAGLGCNLPTLSFDVARAGSGAKQAFEQSIRNAIVEMQAAEPFAGEPDGAERAVAMLSVLTGAMVIARAVSDPKTAASITEAARRAALLIAKERLPDTPRSAVEWTAADY